MPGNSFGTLFKITTYGESHGKSVGVIIDGVPSGTEVNEHYIQKELDRRKPGQSDLTTPRKESDEVHILSGVFEGKATGVPILLALYNKDAEPQAYDAIKHSYRPGHADYTYIQKYGFRDWRGSGRASGRETAARVAAGAIAKKILEAHGVTIIAYTLEAGGIACNRIDHAVIEKNIMRAPDLEAADKMIEKGKGLKEEKNSMGGILECVIQGLPKGLGEPVFDKFDAVLAHAVMSIGAIKAFEIGLGFQASRLTGLEHNDQMTKDGFLSNNAGGVLGGISTGEDLIFRVSVKPPSSIESTQRTTNEEGEEIDIVTEGRHDVCICPRVVPVVEAMSAIATVDLLKLHFSNLHKSN